VKKKIRRGTSWLKPDLAEEYVFWTFRYFHRSHTIAAAAFVQYELPAILPHLGTLTLQKILKEMKNAWDYGDADKAMIAFWEELLECLHAELDKRKVGRRCLHCKGTGQHLPNLVCVHCEGDGRNYK